MMEEVTGTVLISFRNNVIIKNKQLHIYSSVYSRVHAVHAVHTL